MKKTLLTSLLGAALLFIACGDSKGDGDTDNATNPTGASNTDGESSTGNGSSATDPTASGSGGATDDPSASGTETGAGPTTDPTSDTETATTGCEFICEGDGGGGEIACDPFVQDCGDDEKCAAYDMDGDGAWDSTKCVQVTGADQDGGECTSEGSGSGIDSCDKGVMCWNINEEGVGVCVELCTGTAEAPQCAPPETSCVIANMGSLNLCLPGCDPTVQDCTDGNVCVSNFMDGFACVLDASGGMAPAGTPCEFANVCNPGGFCAGVDFAPFPDCDGAGGCCTAFCDLGDGDEPCQQLDPSFSCVPWYEDGQAPPQFMHVGGCGIPA